MLQAYREHIDERAAQGVPPKPLDAQQTAELVDLIKNPPAGEENYLLELLTQHIPAGVDEAAYVKAGFLAAITRGEASTSLIDKVRAVEILGTMLGGYNIAALIACLDDEETAAPYSPWCRRSRSTPSHAHKLRPNRLSTHNQTSFLRHFAFVLQRQELLSLFERQSPISSK